MNILETFRRTFGLFEHIVPGKDEKWLQKAVMQFKWGRKMLYRRLLADMEDSPVNTDGLCYYMSKYFYSLSIKDLPELMKYKPSHISRASSVAYFWFDRNEQGHQARIELLKKAIND